VGRISGCTVDIGHGKIGNPHGHIWSNRKFLIINKLYIN
jgi:hypothetical protein